jgi:SAM-dependent methyltransferase
VNEIISILKKSIFADVFSIYKQINNAKMADINKAITYLQHEKIIHVTGHRKNSRTGVTIPIFSLASEHSSLNITDNDRIGRLDMDGLLAGVLSEREVEYRFLARNLLPIASNMNILDVGSEGSALTRALGRFGNNKKWEVFGIDISEAPHISKKEKGKSRLLLLRMDARFAGFRNQVFDKIICISTVEHIGVQSSYDIVGEYDAGGDVRAFSEIYRILKKGGRVILTVPFTDGSIHGNHKEHRIYNYTTLSILISRFTVKKKEFYIYVEGKWKNCKWMNLAKRLQLLRHTEIPRYLHSRVCLCLLLEK